MLSLSVAILFAASVYGYSEQFGHTFPVGTPEQTYIYVDFWMNAHDHLHDDAEIDADYTNAGTFWWQGWDINMMVYDNAGCVKGSDTWGSNLSTPTMTAHEHCWIGCTCIQEDYDQTGWWHAKFIVDNNRDDESSCLDGWVSWS
ncbi:MAG: hypothetical protein U9N35_05355 [Euryarchaeota archaeon]|nr:hypothetical protein [Euryarchaeota archaeon]